MRKYWFYFYDTRCAWSLLWCLMLKIVLKRRCDFEDCVRRLMMFWEERIWEWSGQSAVFTRSGRPKIIHCSEELITLVVTLPLTMGRSISECHHSRGKEGHRRLVIRGSGGGDTIWGCFCKAARLEGGKAEAWSYGTASLALQAPSMQRIYRSGVFGTKWTWSQLPRGRHWDLEVPIRSSGQLFKVPSWGSLIVFSLGVYIAGRRSSHRQKARKYSSTHPSSNRELEILGLLHHRTKRRRDESANAL